MAPHGSDQAKPRSIIRIERKPIPDHGKRVHVPIDLLLRAAEEYMTPSIHAEIAAEFAPYTGSLQIPALAALQVIDILCVRCFTAYPVEEALRIIGANTLLLYTKSVLLQAMLTTLRLASVEHILRYLPRQFATAYSFGTYEMLEVKAQHWRFTLEDYPIYPDILQGQFETGSHLLRNDAQYRYTVKTTHHCYFDITWGQGNISSAE
jgi:uncharacterized protein (TIGR02265 family)